MALDLADLLYKIEGELPEGMTITQGPHLPVLIVTDDGTTYEPVATAGDGESVIINARRCDPL